MKVYLSGPMTGIPQFNFPQFDEVAAWLLSAECSLDVRQVVNPAEHDRQVLWDDHGCTLVQDVPGYAEGDVATYTKSIGEVPDLLAWDFAQIVECDAIVMLPNWEMSSGARSERLVAEAVGKTVYLATVGGRVAAYDHKTGEQTYAKHYWSISSDIDQRRCHTALQHTLDVVEPVLVLPESPDGEVRIVNPLTGGEKGRKLARMELLPGDALLAVAEHFGRGAAKYADRNWEKGYDWSLSFGAMQRHAWAWWQGQEIDADGFAHRDAMAWHAIVLLAFAIRDAGTDDRPKVA